MHIRDFRSNEEGPSCSLLDVSHATPLILGKLNITWMITLDIPFDCAHSHGGDPTIALAVAALQRAPQREKT